MLGSSDTEVRYLNIDVVYFEGQMPTEVTKRLNSGKLFLGLHSFRLENKSGFKTVIRYSRLAKCELRRHGLGTYLYLTTKQKTLNVFVQRINLFNWFIIANYFKTVEIFKYIKRRML
jgi:hypothetical protein